MTVRDSAGSEAPWPRAAGRVIVAALVAMATIVGLNLTTASAASAAWEDCGDYTCTTYLTREETRAVSDYLNNVVPYSNGAAMGLCAWAGYKGGGIGAVVAAVGCTAFERYDWRSAADDAVAHNACFQVAYSNQWWGKAWPTPGWTSHSSYCFD